MSKYDLKLWEALKNYCISGSKRTKGYKGWFEQYQIMVKAVQKIFGVALGFKSNDEFFSNASYTRVLKSIFKIVDSYILAFHECSHLYSLQHGEPICINIAWIEERVKQWGFRNDKLRHMYEMLVWFTLSILYSALHNYDVVGCFYTGVPCFRNAFVRELLNLPSSAIIESNSIVGFCAMMCSLHINMFSKGIPQHAYRTELFLTSLEGNNKVYLDITGSQFESAIKYRINCNQELVSEGYRVKGICFAGSLYIPLEGNRVVAFNNAIKIREQLFVKQQFLKYATNVVSLVSTDKYSAWMRDRVRFVSNKGDTFMLSLHHFKAYIVCAKMYSVMATTDLRLVTSMTSKLNVGGVHYTLCVVMNNELIEISSITVDIGFVSKYFIQDTTYGKCCNKNGIFASDIEHANLPVTTDDTDWGFFSNENYMSNRG